MTPDPDIRRRVCLIHGRDDCRCIRHRGTPAQYSTTGAALGCLLAVNLVAVLLVVPAAVVWFVVEVIA